ncbi:MAG: hypothetical protein PHT00_01490 [Candidatus Methanomethylophilus sp.]|nr:hypothetical protein [Methanomethylophilus sp.]MDD3232829.1 hypothetical protein [Methanomethylophilus sp.]MDD4669367.1 hypothetical protein [Methanomethylophilus sp.]
MTEITEGTWFAYQMTATESGKSRSDVSIEKYTIAKISADGGCIVVKNINGVDVDTLETKADDGSCIFSLKGLEKRGSENMNTAFGHIYVNIYETPDRSGDSERVFLGKDNVVFRDIRTQVRDGSSLYTETRELSWTNMKL